MASNCRIRVYKHFAKVSVSDSDIYGEKKRPLTEWEKIQRSSMMELRKSYASEKSNIEARRRARQAIYDITACNDFAWMCTLTFTPEKVNRYDVEEVYKKISNWLRERVREGAIYIAVPELHKDGAIHLHALFSDQIAMLPSLDSRGRQRKDKQGRLVFEIEKWKNGISFCTRIENYDSAVAYCCKYISKGDKKLFGKYYLSARACVKKPQIYDTEKLIDEQAVLDLYETEVDKKDCYETHTREAAWLWTFYAYPVEGDALVLPCRSGDILHFAGYGCYSSGRVVYCR